MKLLVVGAGAREHALAWKLRQSPQVRELMIAPGHAGTAGLGRNVPVPATDVAALVALARAEAVDLTVVGPETLHQAGIVDAFRAAGLAVVGPTAAAARLSGSRVFARQFMRRHHIPTAPFQVCEDAATATRFVTQHWHGPGLVLKPDADTPGNGVVMPGALEEAVAYIQAFFAQPQPVRLVIETRLRGREVLVPLLVDGESWLLLPWLQVLAPEGEAALPVPGAIGAYAPAGRRESDAELVLREVVQPTLTALQAEGMAYAGVLGLELMFTSAGPQVLGYRTGFGERETPITLPVLPADLLVLLQVALAQRLDDVRLPEPDQVAFGWQIPAGRDVPIQAAGLGERHDVLVFHGSEPSPAFTCVGLGAARVEAQEAAQQALAVLTGTAPLN